MHNVVVVAQKFEQFVMHYGDDSFISRTLSKRVATRLTMLQKELKRVVLDPSAMIGKPVIKGTRMPINLIVEKLAVGETIPQLLDDYPFLKEDDIRAALFYSARSVSREEVYAI